MKITIEKFRKIKNKLILIVNELNEKSQTEEKTKEYYEYEDKKLVEYSQTIQELLNYDLSDIPFEEWEGMFIYSEETLDFSKTHANIDLALLAGIEADGYIFHGCNVRNPFKIKFDKNTFDEKYKEDNSDIFFVDKLPEEVKERFYSRVLIFQDLLDYPELEKIITEDLMVGGYQRYSLRNLFETFGYDNIMKLFHKYPEFVAKALSNEEHSQVYFLHLPEEKISSYEEIKKYFFDEVLATMKQHYTDTEELERLIPREMIDMYPNVFLTDSSLPQEVFKAYKEGRLTINMIRNNLDYFKNVDVAYGIRNSSSYYQIENHFGDVIKYIESIPRAFDSIVQEYVRSLRYNDKEEKIEINPDEIILSSIKHAYGRNKASNLPLEDIREFLKYVSVEYILENKELCKIITKYGIDNLCEFNKKYNYILDRRNDRFYKSTILESISQISNGSFIDDASPTQESLLKYLKEVIHRSRQSNYSNYNLIELTRKDFSKLFPKEYIDRDAIIKLLQNMNREKKNDIAYELESGFNGDTLSLAKLLNQYPNLISEIRNKNIIIDNHIYRSFAENVGTDKFIDIISKYGPLFLDYLYTNSSYISKEYEELVSLIKDNGNYEEKLNKLLYEHISSERKYDIRLLPESFRISNPDLFLDSGAPNELKRLFYLGKIGPSEMQHHPEWIEYLKKVNYIKCIKQLNITTYDSSADEMYIMKQMPSFKALETIYSEEEIFKIIADYGECLENCSFVLDFGKSKSENYEYMIEAFYKQIMNKAFAYSDKYMPQEFKERYPELFLDEEAPTELKRHFYNADKDTPLTFEKLREHKEWLNYIKGKNVLLSLQRSNPTGIHFEKLFKRYGQDEAIKIGIKNPESVEFMLLVNPELLFEWYDKLHFIPHYVVMQEFPIEESDKFLASGKKWSQLMKLNRYNLSADSKSAILKASMCFGVFDNDTEGYNKTVELFSNIPSTLSEEDYNLYKSYYSLFPKVQGLIDEAYRKSDNGKYVLTINQQKNKDIVGLLRASMETAEISTIMTLDKAHKLFGGFKMMYDPTFRDFILKNMETILSSSDYISYVSAMQKKWSEIKAFNSNRVLTLDLALAFVKENAYINVETGNYGLAEASSAAGYTQAEFDRLQEIYNIGKTRVASSIPRIEGKVDKYNYQILRLDDPYATAIGTLTDCCQEIGNAAQSSMEHSVTDKHGRIFLIKDNEGNFIAQSWVWRNQNIICFDNIEIPRKAFDRASQEGLTREEFTKKIYDIYKQAGNDLIEKDKLMYEELLEEGSITEEQFDTLRLTGVTVGLGYNDIASAIINNSPKVTGKLAHTINTTGKFLYTHDSEEQFLMAGKAKYSDVVDVAPIVYVDDYVILDGSTIKIMDIKELEKLEFSTYHEDFRGRTRLYNIKEDKEIMDELAYNYGTISMNMKIIKNANFAIIYEKTSDGKIIVHDLLYNRVLGNNTDITQTVIEQIELAVEQLGDYEFDISRLNEEQLEMFPSENRVVM